MDDDRMPVNTTVTTDARPPATLPKPTSAPKARRSARRKTAKPAPVTKAPKDPVDPNTLSFIAYTSDERGELVHHRITVAAYHEKGLG